jgi:hypothetical protein
MFTTITIVMASTFVATSFCYIWLLPIGNKDKDAITFNLLATTTFMFTCSFNVMMKSAKP